MYTWTPCWLPTRQLDRLVARICYKANGDVCRTAVILDAAHGNIQQPAHNLVSV